MLKPELIAAVATEAGITKADAEKIINNTMRLIADSISKDGRFEFAGFGVFKKAKRKASDRPNPQDRTKRVLTPARNTVTFKPSPALKELVNG